MHEITHVRCKHTCRVLRFVEIIIIIIIIIITTTTVVIVVVAVLILIVVIIGEVVSKQTRLKKNATY